MKGIHVTSEINPLKKVLLHRPGKELLNLTPDSLKDLLFDDIPYLKAAQEEHDLFAKILRDNGVEVVYLEDLMTEVLDLYPDLVKPFLHRWLEEGNIRTTRWKDKLIRYLLQNYEGKALVEKTMEGITLREMAQTSRSTPWKTASLRPTISSSRRCRTSTSRETRSLRSGMERC